MVKRNHHNFKLGQDQSGPDHSKIQRGTALSVFYSDGKHLGDFPTLNKFAQKFRIAPKTINKYLKSGQIYYKKGEPLGFLFKQLNS